MRLLAAFSLGALALVAAGCRSGPRWEPVGGFELVTAAGPWRDVEAKMLRDRLREARERLDEHHAHAATLETRERIEDALHPRRVMRLEVQREPFAARVETLAPESEAGQRAGYDAARSREMWAETPGFLGKLVGRVSLDPRGDLAMANRRHPITDLGLWRLLAQVEEALGPQLARRSPPRIRAAERASGPGPEQLFDVVLPSEAPDPPLVHRLGFDADSGLLTSYGLAQLLPDGLALVEEYWYHDVELDPDTDAP